MKLIASLAIFFVTFQNLDCHHGPPGRGRKLNPRFSFFDIELLQYSAEEKKGNVMISPASVKSTLSMLLEGANGDTANELARALRLSSDKHELREQLQLYLTALRSNSTSAVLENANGIFVSNKLKLNKAYEEAVKKSYFSEVTYVDFNDANAAAVVINSWVTQNTHGLIPFVIEPVHVSPLTDMILTNTLYFKSTWHQAFDPRLTKGSCFYLHGDCKMVAMMDMQADLNYAYVDDLRAHAVELPYEGKHYSMILLVPIDQDGIEGLLRDLPYVNLPMISDQMAPIEVQLTMPKFTVNYNRDLVEPLRKMQITNLFSSKSNLSGIFPTDAPYVNSFYHKVFVSVDESGTVAAAASSAMVVPLIYNGGVEVKVDRPFLFFIRDNEQGIVIFEGKIEEPSELAIGSHGQIPVNSPPLNKKTVHADNSGNTKRKTSFVDNLKSIFG